MLSATAADLLKRVDLPLPDDTPPTPLLRVEVRLVSRGPSGQRTELGGVFAYQAFAGVEPSEPLCVEVSRETAGKGRSMRLVQALVEAKAQTDVPCLVDSEVLDAWGRHRP